MVCRKERGKRSGVFPADVVTALEADRGPGLAQQGVIHQLGLLPGTPLAHGTAQEVLEPASNLRRHYPPHRLRTMSIEQRAHGIPDFSH